MRILVVNDELNHQTASVPRLRISWRDTQRRVTTSRWWAPFETDATRRNPCGRAADRHVLPDYLRRFRWRGLYFLDSTSSRPLAQTKPDIVRYNVHNHLSFACLPLARKAGTRVPDYPRHDAVLDGKLVCFDAATTFADVHDGTVDSDTAGGGQCGATDSATYPFATPSCDGGSQRTSSGSSASVTR
jgi:hypothetical protein